MMIASHNIVVLGMTAFMLCLMRLGRKPAYLVELYDFRLPGHVQDTNEQMVQGYEATGVRPE